MSKKPPSRDGWIAFNPNEAWLELLEDHYVTTIINRALAGKVTPAGKKLLLIPDRRIGRKGACGTYKIGRVKNSECITVENLVRAIHKAEGVTDTADSGKSRSCKNRHLEPEKGAKMSTPTLPMETTEKASEQLSESPSRNICAACPRTISGRRSDAKYCSSACRQRNYRRES